MELLGIFLPIIIDLINRKIADSDLRFWVSVGICAVVGIFLNFLNTSFHFETALIAFESISSSVMIVFGLAQLSYNALWSKSGIRDALTLNAKTNNEN